MICYAAEEFYAVENREGQVAQLVEQGTENPRVGGSIPPLATNLGSLAQSVEQRTFNPQVVGSIPTRPTSIQSV